MAIIKQRQIPSGALKLKRLKNDHKELSSNQYKYVIELPDGDRLDPRFTRDNAERVFEDVAERRGGGGGGFFGGGGGLFDGW